MQAHEFQIGRRYRDRIGNYEVLDISGDRLTVRYDDGREDTKEACIAARIHSNMGREDAQQLPKELRPDAERDFAWTIGVLARYGDLQADLPPRAANGFTANYREVTGLASLDGVKGVVFLQRDTDKWGVELRIYLPELIAEHPRFTLPLGVEVSAGFGVGTKRINKNAFWWHLVQRLNFRLGRKQDLVAIETAMPEYLREAFREGAGFHPS